MGWNDHHPGIDPADPDPGETLRGMADAIRDRQKYEPPTLCIQCGENWTARTRCTQCERANEIERMDREIGR